MYINAPPAPAAVSVNQPRPVYAEKTTRKPYNPPPPQTPKYEAPKPTRAPYKPPTTQAYKQRQTTKPSYNPPAPSYAPPKPTYAPPKPVYKPKPSYKPPPKQTYNEPAPSYKPQQAPHIIYAGHPPIHIYQQPPVLEAQSHPAPVYNPPAPVYKPQPTSAPATTKAVYNPPAPTKPTYRAPPTAVKPTYKKKQIYKAQQKPAYRPSKPSYKPQRPRQRPQYQAPSKKEPVYVPAPRKYNKPPIIIYQGVRPPVHVYEKPNEPKPSYAAPTPVQSYAAPKPTYSVPKQTYSAPKPTYAAPKPTYAAPKKQKYQAKSDINPINFESNVRNNIKNPLESKSDIVKGKNFRVFNILI